MHTSRFALHAGTQKPQKRVLAIGGSLAIALWAVAGCSGANTPDLIVSGSNDASTDAGSNPDSTSSADGALQSQDSSPPPLNDDAASTTDSTPPVDSDSATANGDPCPSIPVTFNCSATCGASVQSCDDVQCQKLPVPAAEKIRITSYDQLPMVIRTPDHPGVSGACSAACGNSATSPAYAVAFDFSLPYYKNGLRIIVGAPFKIGRFSMYAPFCKDSANQEVGCTYLPGTSEDELIWTDDPNAPSRNIVIEEAPQGQQCP